MLRLERLLPKDPKTFKAVQIASYLLVLILIVLAKLYGEPAKLFGEPVKQPAEKMDLSEAAASLTKTYEIAKTNFKEIQEVVLNQFEVTVEGVIDGDTVKIAGANYRLAFIDAPEIGQDFGKEASAFLNALIGNKTVLIEPLDINVYGRQIINVTIENISVADIMVENGFAWPYFVSDVEQNKKLMLLKQKAKEGKKGLWSKPNPVRPSEYRKINANFNIK